MVNEMGLSPSRNFSISAVFSRAFGVMGGNPVTVFGVAFIFGTLPQLLLNIVLRGPMLAGAMQGATSMRGYWAASMLFWLASMLLTMIVIGALVRTTAAYADGRKIGFGEGVMAVLPKLLPLLGLSLLSIVGLAIGWMLLLVPGVILACMWAVNAPALVEEDVGVIGAFGRSRHLTKGVRWPIFGLFAVMLVIIWLATAAVGIVMVMGFGAAALVNPGGLPILYYVVAAIPGTVTTAIWGTIVAALYVELREWKEGPASTNLAEIFA